jgi:hypothetical protein
MAHSTSISHVGDKLVVGQVDTSFLTATSRVLPGTAVLNGPVYIGATPQVGIARASCMIGPPLPGLSVPASLEVTGVANIFGSFNVVGNSIFTGAVTVTGVSIFNGARISNSSDLKNGIDIANPISICNSNNIVNGRLILSGIGDVASFMLITRAIASFKKGFDIPHPTKENHRLRYICVEGPSAEVYFRGELKDSSTIEIPEYWSNLVDKESIGVTLTPIRCHQELFVDRIEGNKIYVRNNASGPIHCYYMIFGERIDGEKNIPEYEGLTPNDYPGDNSEYTINGL